MKRSERKMFVERNETDFQSTNGRWSSCHEIAAEDIFLQLEMVRQTTVRKLSAKAPTRTKAILRASARKFNFFSSFFHSSVRSNGKERRSRNIWRDYFVISSFPSSKSAIYDILNLGQISLYWLNSIWIVINNVNSGEKKTLLFLCVHFLQWCKMSKFFSTFFIICKTIE